MNNQKEIYEALLAGETLISVNFIKLKMVDGYVHNERDEVIDANFANVDIWQIYKEPKWYENIPDGGVLCKVLDKQVDVIFYYDDSYNYCFNAGEEAYISAIPLTKQEIQAFMDNAPSDD